MSTGTATIEYIMEIPQKIKNRTTIMLNMLICVWFFATQWTVAHQAPLSMGFI